LTSSLSPVVFVFKPFVSRLLRRASARREFLYYTPFIWQVKEKTGLNIVVWVISVLF